MVTGNEAARESGTGHDLADYVALRRPALIRSAVLLGCDLDEAEDLVQTTLVKVTRSWRRIRRAEQPDAYVYRVLVNSFRDSRSRRWRGEIPTARVPDDPIPETDTTTGLVVRRALAAMQPDHREVLVLRFFADLTERDTATVLDVPRGTVKSRPARALPALADDPTLARRL